MLRSFLIGIARPYHRDVRPVRWWLLLTVAAATVGLVIAALPYTRTTALLLDLSEADPLWRALLPVSTATVTWTDAVIPARGGPVPARVYRPDRETRRPVVIVPGVHTGGVEEPRLAALGRRLAASGAIVVTVPIPGLRTFDITPSATDAVEDVAIWASRSSQVGRGRPVGLVGTSFAGGLAIVAAGRPALAGRLTGVVSIGGHGDLPRVVRFLATGRMADGHERAPNDYAVAVLLLSALDRLAPADQQANLHGVLQAYLAAASAVSERQADAPALFERVSALSERLPAPASEIVREVRARDTASIARRLAPIVDEIGTDPSLSPERSPLPTVPIFLIHGTDDAVIPPTETEHLAAWAAARGAHVEWLETPFLTHVTVDADVPPGAALAIVRFWTHVMQTLR